MPALVRQKKIEATVTYLEMTAPLSGKPVAAPRDCVVARTHNPPLHFYRYLYHQIGAKHHWVSRKKMSDRTVLKIIHDPLVEIYVLYQDGVPAGFCEMDFRKPKLGEIVFLGLIEEKIGKGLGWFLLHRMLQTAWQHDINRLMIETCTLDHPRALGLYQQVGFEITTQKKVHLSLNT